MDFFEAQEQARRRTKWLVLWFVLSVVGVVIAVDVLVVVVMGGSGGGEMAGVLLVTSAITGGMILAASGFKSMQLSAGGSVVAQDLGGRLLMPGTGDHKEKRLLNIVEEMAIASGMPVPQVYLMDSEEGINAFAAGTEPSNAVIGVTRGCLQRLSREELSGVVAHEFSHILNGDMRLNMRLMGLVFGLVVISIVGRGMVEMLRFQSFSSRRDREGGGAALALLALGIGLIIIGSLGVFFGRLIQASISRQREFLADASAVQFTRNPDGIANALKKIGGQGSGGKIRTAKASEASHMFFSDSGLFSFGLATHPPLDIRIKAIEQSWDGKFVASELPEVAAEETERSGDSRGDDFLKKVVAMTAVEAMGQDSQRRYQAGKRLHHELEDRWATIVHDREKAQAFVFALLLAEDDVLLQGEESYLRKTAGVSATRLALAWQDELRAMHSAKKIALLDLVMPTLRNLSRKEYERFLSITRWLIVSDNRVDLFEFMLQRVVERHLTSHFDRRGFGKIRYTRLSQLRDEANQLISTMAHMGAGDLDEQEASFSAGMKGLKLGVPDFSPSTSLDDLGEVLDRFDQASPIVKQDILIACGRAAASDGDLTNREAELLRSVADSIGCPIPPFVDRLEKTAN
ncbi:M48 family metallopeptidase [Akkermansiaceae bacterium]|nr:M48 family metallopeptidase [Akkermansiaceae bacterium]